MKKPKKLFYSVYSRNFFFYDLRNFTDIDNNKRICGENLRLLVKQS
jgi:hypothetical protein